MLVEKAIRALAIALIAFGFLEILSWMTQSVPPCLIEVKEKTDCPTFYMGLKIFAARYDSFLEGHDKTVVGSFTILLAFFTLGLWLSTRVLWQVTRIHAQHVRTAERASIHGGWEVNSLMFPLWTVPGFLPTSTIMGKPPHSSHELPLPSGPATPCPKNPNIPKGSGQGLCSAPTNQDFRLPQPALGGAGVKDAFSMVEFGSRTSLTTPSSDTVASYSTSTAGSRR
jgi:hypothetical protein